MPRALVRETLSRLLCCGAAAVRECVRGSADRCTPAHSQSRGARRAPALQLAARQPGVWTTWSTAATASGGFFFWHWLSPLVYTGYLIQYTGYLVPIASFERGNHQRIHKQQDRQNVTRQKQIAVHPTPNCRRHISFYTAAFLPCCSASSFLATVKMVEMMRSAFSEMLPMPASTKKSQKSCHRK